MQQSGFKIALSNICILFLGVGFLGMGMLKLVGYKDIVAAFDTWGYPQFFMILIGIFEILLAIGILFPNTRKYANLSAFVLMAGAIITHINAGEFNQLYGPIIISILLILLWFSNGFKLR